MPEVKSNKRPMVPAGEHLLTLKEVAEVEVAAYQRPGTVTKWAWRFEADCLDPKEGLPYEHTVWTMDKYGGAKANLTKLLDMIIPRATKEQKQSLKTEVLYGRRFKAMIIHRSSQAGGILAEAAYITPTDTPMDPKERANAPVHHEDEEGGLGSGVELDNPDVNDPVLAAEMERALDAPGIDFTKLPPARTETPF